MLIVRSDPTKLVAASIEAGKPIIFVSINYRLNIFSFGDGKEKNLALKDQQLGIEWVRNNIASFGGDPVSIFRSSSTHALTLYRPTLLSPVRAPGPSTPMRILSRVLPSKGRFWHQVACTYRLHCPWSEGTV